MYVIDGLHAIEACYYFAGIVGVHPRGLTLRQLWMMSEGRIRQQRFGMIEMAFLSIGQWDFDVDEYRAFGIMHPTGKGSPVKLKPELEEKVRAEVERIKAEQKKPLTVKVVK